MYGDNCLSAASLFLRHKRFLEGRERLEDDNREGRPISAMLITFFNSKGIIYRVFLPTGQTITEVFFPITEVLKRLVVRIRSIRPEYRDPETWSLLHDNALSHNSLIVRQFLSRNQFCVSNYPLHSPDFALCDFFLFPKLKLKGCFFNEISATKTAKTRALEAIPPNESEDAFESLLNCCNKCIETEGEYIK